MKKIIQMKYSKDIKQDELDRITARMVGIDEDILVLVMPDTINLKELSLDELATLREACGIAMKEILDDYAKQRDEEKEETK